MGKRGEQEDRRNDGAVIKIFTCGRQKGILRGEIVISQHGGDSDQEKLFPAGESLLPFPMNTFEAAEAIGFLFCQRESIGAFSFTREDDYTIPPAEGKETGAPSNHNSKTADYNTPNNHLSPARPDVGVDFNPDNRDWSLLKVCRR